MDIVAHRGASFDAPENTLASVRLGFEQGADLAEVDVHLSRDRRLVVIHDPTTKRTGQLNRRVANLDLTQLKTLDVGAWKGREWAGERIPALEEVLDILPPGRRLFIELKGGVEILPPLARLLRLSNQAVMIAFDLETLRVAKRQLPHIPMYWISAFKRETLFGPRKPTPARLLEMSLAADLDGLDLLHSGPISADFVKVAHSAGQKVYAWTVDRPATARNLLALGLDGVATNRPGWLRAQLGASE